jgi:hypothetical protein
MPTAPPAALLATKEQALVDLSQWIARALQYTPGHASCAPLAARTHAALTAALELTAPLEFGILKDDVVMDGDAPATHPALRTRLAPYLHERGVLVLRFAAGTTAEDLTVLVELLARRAQAVFEAGGLAALLRERGVTRVQVDEIAHEISSEEREEHQRRRMLRILFADLVRAILAGRGAANVAPDEVSELFAHPDIAVAELEDAADVAQAAACLALMAEQEDAKSGARPLLPQLRVVLAMLSPHTRGRVLLGLPRLDDELRGALARILRGYAPEELARFLFATLAERAADLDEVLVALSAVLPRDEPRVAVLRAASLHLHDLPADDPAASAALAALVAPVGDRDPFRVERLCLAEQARAALTIAQQAAEWRDALAAHPPPGELPRFDGSAAVFELVKMAGGMKDFDQVAGRLPAAVAGLAARGSIDAVIGVLRGLGEIDAAQWKNVAPDAIAAIATPGTVARVVEELDREGAVEGRDVDHLASLVKTLARQCPQPLFDWLERSADRKVRRILLEALPLAEKKLLPILRARARDANWHVARNVVLLLPRAGGTTADLEPLSRHENPRVRLEVVRSLRLLPADATTESIAVTYLVDESAELARAARTLIRAETLGAESIETLARQAEEEKLDEDRRRFAIETLGRSASDAAAAALFRILQPKGLLELGTSSIRDLAATALHGSKAPSARALFAEGLASTVWRVRKACERAAEKP